MKQQEKATKKKFFIFIGMLGHCQILSRDCQNIPVKVITTTDAQVMFIIIFFKNMHCSSSIQLLFVANPQRNCTSVYGTEK